MFQLNLSRIRVAELSNLSALSRWMHGVSASPRRLNLALQGGGAHGAFTWGVLDALLEDPRFDFEGLSGSSAGAMNAVIFANGWMLGGRDGARQALFDFWTEIGKQMPSAMVMQGDDDAFSLTPASKLLVKWSGYFSPSQLNPFDLNPLRDLLNRKVDFEQLRRRSPFKLFIGATQVNTGKLRIFRESELNVDVLLASACLPMSHHAVEIEGEPYWDGGYSANPAVFPLFYECTCSDVLLVILSPLKREGTPRTREEIESRIINLGFSANFMREMQMFFQMSEYSSRGFLKLGKLEQRLQNIRFHMIDTSHLDSMQRNETKLLAHGPFLEVLRGQGRECSLAWLEDKSDGIGKRSTVDLKQYFC